MTTVNMWKNLSIAGISAAFTILGAVGAAQAATFTESNDAGQTLGTAQKIGSNVNVIRGSISSNNDADLFSFSWGGGLFKASTVGGADFDTVLQLFDSTGVILAWNNDEQPIPQQPPISLQSILNLNLDPGNYFLRISSSPNFALPGFFDKNPGFSSGNYTITLNQASVPEPTAIMGLLFLGAVGATCQRKSKQEKAIVKA
ncbi:MAG TPA: DVUA0089 family protein [Leptolyngbyaceae cyanobacterium]